MAALKLLLDDAFDFDFSLIAIHCSLEDYRLAFMANKYAGLRLKSSKDVDFYIKKLKYSFASFKYDDQKNYQTFTLIANKYKIKQAQRLVTSDLFADSESAEVSAAKFGTPSPVLESNAVKTAELKTSTARIRRVEVRKPCSLFIHFMRSLPRCFSLMPF